MCVCVCVCVCVHAVGPVCVHAVGCVCVCTVCVHMQCWVGCGAGIQESYTVRTVRHCSNDLPERECVCCARVCVCVLVFDLIGCCSCC